MFVYFGIFSNASAKPNENYFFSPLHTVKNSFVTEHKNGNHNDGKVGASTEGGMVSEVVVVVFKGG